MKIIWGDKRESRRFGFSLNEYYKVMVERWNTFIDSRGDWEMDKRTNKAMRHLAESVLYLEDMIIQTEAAHRAEVDALKKELAKWTENRGRKPSLSAEERKQIDQRRADGESCRKLARDFGVSERTIRRALAVKN
jgi:hypothetical protein